MNRKLKARIIQIYGSQYEFSRAIKEHEAVVSRVVRNKKQLDPKEKQRWAQKLGIKNPSELFCMAHQIAKIVAGTHGESYRLDQN